MDRRAPGSAGSAASRSGRVTPTRPAGHQKHQLAGLGVRQHLKARGLSLPAGCVTQLAKKGSQLMLASDEAMQVGDEDHTKVAPAHVPECSAGLPK